MLCDHLEGRDRESGREAQEGGDICISIADSLCCTTETNTLYSNKDELKKNKNGQRN